MYDEPMTFSIRELLGLGFIVALALVTYRTYTETNKKNLRLMQLRVEMKALEVRLEAAGPISQLEDEFAPLHESQKRAKEHFPRLRKKYSTIETRGPDVFSFRLVPNLDRRRTEYIIIVPEKRSVWFKYGVHMVRTSTSSSRESDKVDRATIR